MFYTWFLPVDFASKVIKKTTLNIKIAYVILIFQKQTFDVSVKTHCVKSNKKKPQNLFFNQLNKL